MLIANAKIIRLKHQIPLAGISFNPHHYSYLRRRPLLIAEHPEIRLSSIHGAREIGLAILRSAFLKSPCLRGVMMPFLPVLPEEQASAEVKNIYEYVTRRWGFLPNYFQALGHDAQLLQDQVNLYTNAMNEERGLPKIIKEQIATVVSGINMSSYCLPAHLEILGRMGMDKSLSRRLSIDYKSAPLDPKVMELLKFCEKLTANPGDMRRADIEKLRELGWNDAAIFDAVLVTSLYACANRFSSGLGLTPDFD
jgi:uncharacterized peroxidase-related enzyme